jgi:hypothetical protein
MLFNAFHLFFPREFLQGSPVFRIRWRMRIIQYTFGQSLIRKFKHHAVSAVPYPRSADIFADPKERGGGGLESGVLQWSVGIGAVYANLYAQEARSRFGYPT